jgi:putative ABC transport system ATP-binding protein
VLNLIGCLDQPSTGSIVVDGRDVGASSVKALADFRLRKIGFIFQSYNLIPVLTAEENAEFTLMLRGVAKEERHQRVRALFAELGIAGLEGRRPNDLSGGQQQRVAVARAMSAEPAVILADEPTANLDSKSAEDLLTLMRRLNEEKGTTFVSAPTTPRHLPRPARAVPADGRLRRTRGRKSEKGQPQSPHLFNKRGGFDLPCRRAQDALGKRRGECPSAASFHHPNVCGVEEITAGKATGAFAYFWAVGGVRGAAPAKLMLLFFSHRPRLGQDSPGGYLKSLDLYSESPPESGIPSGKISVNRLRLDLTGTAAEGIDVELSAENLLLYTDPAGLIPLPRASVNRRLDLEKNWSEGGRFQNQLFVDRLNLRTERFGAQWTLGRQAIGSASSTSSPPSTSSPTFPPTPSTQTCVPASTPCGGCATSASAARSAALPSSATVRRTILTSPPSR